MGPVYPFQRTFTELETGETIHTAARRFILSDIKHFAEFTRGRFYAYMGEEAACANPFFPIRLAHGYLLLSFATGLFVQPDPSPFLANTGLKNLSFQKPVSPGEPSPQDPPKQTAMVRWRHIALIICDGEIVVTCELFKIVFYTR